MSSLSGTQPGSPKADRPDRTDKSEPAAKAVPEAPQASAASAAPAGSAAVSAPAAPAPAAASASAATSAATASAARGLRPDVALLRKAQAGDRGAYGQIVELYQDRLYNAVLRLVGDREEARDLAQEAFTRGLMSLSSFRGDASPYTWLFRIAVNLAISQLRKVQRNRVFSLDRPGAAGSGRGGGGYAYGSAHGGNGRVGGGGGYSASHDAGDDQASGLLDRVSRDRQRDAAETPAGRLETRERDQAVLEALGRLDAEYRAVLVMRDIEGFDYQQMADVLGLPLGTLKSRLFRARVALRDQLKSYLNDPKEK